MCSLSGEVGLQLQQRSSPLLSWGDLWPVSAHDRVSLGPLHSQHLLRKFVFINVTGRVALPRYLKAPCSSRKARAGGLRWAGSPLPCSELAGSPRVFPNRWVQILPHPGFIHPGLGLRDFPAGVGGLSQHVGGMPPVPAGCLARREVGTRAVGATRDPWAE